MWVFKSASVGTNLGDGVLAAVWYLDGGKIRLSGSSYVKSGSSNDAPFAVPTTGAAGTLITTDATDKLFTLEIFNSTDETNPVEKIKFGFDDTKETFIRKRFNTNPQLRTSAGFYPASSEKTYWLGETFEQELRDASFTTAYTTDLTSNTDLVGLIAAPP